MSKQTTREAIAQELRQTIDHGRDYTQEWLLHRSDRILSIMAPELREAWVSVKASELGVVLMEGT